MYVVSIADRPRGSASSHLDSLAERVRNHTPADQPDMIVIQRDSERLTTLLTDTDAVIDTALHALRLGQLSVGIGIGRLDSSDQEHLAGPGLDASRQALLAAAKQGQIAPVRVHVAQPSLNFDSARFAEHAQSVLQLLGHTISRRSVAEWAVIDIMTPGMRGQQRDVAEALGITVQAVSQAIKRSLFKSEHQVRAAIAAHLEASYDHLYDRHALAEHGHRV